MLKTKNKITLSLTAGILAIMLIFSLCSFTFEVGTSYDTGDSDDVLTSTYYQTVFIGIFFDFFGIKSSSGNLDCFKADFAQFGKTAVAACGGMQIVTQSVTLGGNL